MHTFLPRETAEKRLEQSAIPSGTAHLRMLGASANPEASVYMMGGFVDCDGKLQLKKTSSCTGTAWKLLTETSIPPTAGCFDLPHKAATPRETSNRDWLN